MNSKTERTLNFFNRMAALGFTYDEAAKLRRIDKVTLEIERKGQLLSKEITLE